MLPEVPSRTGEFNAKVASIVKGQPAGRDFTGCGASDAKNVDEFVEHAGIVADIECVVSCSHRTATNLCRLSRWRK